MNQTRKNVRSTKKHENVELTQAPVAAKLGSAAAVLSRGEYGRKSESFVPQAFEEPNTSKLAGRKARDVYTKVYDVRNTVFSDQTGQFPTRSQSGNKYLMFMVEIDSNAILVEPLKKPEGPRTSASVSSNDAAPKTSQDLALKAHSR